MNLERIMVNMWGACRNPDFSLGPYAPGGGLVEYHRGNALWCLVRIQGGPR